MELHLRYTRLVANYYAGTGSPFFVSAKANDGHEYGVGEVEVQRCRCAKWNRDTREYIEEGTLYREETWTGPGEGIAFVTRDEERIR